MVTLDSILQAVKRYSAEPNLETIRKAYEISRAAHEGQTRRSGEPYFNHPMEVAYILASHRMDAETVSTGLLHDVVEDTLISLDRIQEEFGPDIAGLVDGVTKLSKVSFQAKDVRQAESFRKMLLAMAQDIRVIIVKLADRLHNMRTLEHMPPLKQVGIAQETLEIYAPLANRLGMAWVKMELEDLAFRFSKPEAYAQLNASIENSAGARDSYIARVIQEIGDKMKTEQVRCEVTGRHKHLYSIYKKMEARNLSYDQIADILAFRIIVDSISQCYEVLGHIHTLWKPVPGRFKDYLALPKTNGYQSLHTTLIGPDGERIEVQIRTRQMHGLAEEGIAAHWIYKTGDGAKQKDLDRFGWLRQMVDSEHDLKDSHEFIETVKIDLFADEVYVFTPKGEVQEFPRGSTPIDFAYRVHSQVGHHCHGARVNGKMVPLKYKLQNGDTVEILTTDHSHPTKDWLKLAVTSKAKSKIRAVLKLEQRESAREVGKSVLEKELKKVGETYDGLMSSGRLKIGASVAGFDSLDDLLLALGYGKAEPKDLLPHLVPPEALQSAKAPRGTEVTVISRTLPKERSAIKVGGLDDIMIRYGKCCDPLPGDPILGFVTRGRGVTVHKTNCYKVLEVDNARKIDVEWTMTSGGATRSVRIKVISHDVPGILADISKTISLKGGNISHASVKTTFDKKAINTFDVNVSHAEQLLTLIRSIEQLRGIISVERIKA